MDVDAEGKAWLQQNGLISDKDRLRNIVYGKGRVTLTSQAKPVF